MPGLFYQRERDTHFVYHSMCRAQHCSDIQEMLQKQWLMGKPTAQQSIHLWDLLLLFFLRFCLLFVLGRRKSSSLDWNPDSLPYVADCDGSEQDLLGRLLVRTGSWFRDAGGLASGPPPRGQTTRGHLVKLSRHCCWLIGCLGKNYLLGSSK